MFYNETMEIIQAIDQRQVLCGSNQTLYIQSGSRLREIPHLSGQRIYAKLMEYQDAHLSQKELAQKAQLSEAQISQYIRSPQRNISRDTVLFLVFSDLDRQPEHWLNLQEVDHFLVQVSRNILSTRTCCVEENRRNFIIRQVFTHLQAHPASDVPSVCFLNYVLARLGFVPISNQAIPASLPEAESLCASINEALPAIEATDVRILRQQLLQAACPENPPISQLTQKIGQKFPISPSTCARFFSGTQAQASKASRDSILFCGCFLGCTIGQLNQMLEESNDPLIYPRIPDATFQDLLNLISIERRELHGNQ